MALEKGGIPQDDRRDITELAVFGEESSSGECNKRQALVKTVWGF